MLEQFQDAHRHPAALQADALALPLILLRLYPRLRLLRWDGDSEVSGARGRECTFEIGEIGVVGRGFREGEAPEREFD